MRPILLAALLLSACDKPINFTSEDHQQGVDIVGLKARTESLDERLFALEYKDDGRSGSLGPNDSGYTLVESDLGKLTFQIMDVKPFANGSRLTVRIGNTTSATITTLTADMTWGRREDGKFIKTGNQTDKNIEGSIEAGQWSSVTIQIPDLKPSEFGYLNIENVSAKRILLLG